MAVFALLTLYVFSTQAFAEALTRSLESQYPPVVMDQVPRAEAIVVLGGYLHSPSRDHPTAEMTEAGDRLWMGARLFRAGKAPLIVLTGGNVKNLGESGPIAESAAAKDLIEQWQVPGDAVLTEQKSQNTRENATLSAGLLAARNARHILLVTSAFHMPRAVAIFREVGLEVTPVPTDYQSGWSDPGVFFSFLPDAEQMYRSKLMVREWVGLAVYRLRGWA